MQQNRLRGVLITLLCSLVMPFAAFAQTTPPPLTPLAQIPLVVTWRAQSLTPTWYQGKVLPTRGSNVTAYVQALSNGRNADIAKYTIEWSMNGTRWATGIGRTTFDFTVSDLAPPSYDLAVTLRSIDTGQIAGRATAIIPIATPVIALNIKYPNKVLPKQDAVVEALLYFFSGKNEADLNFSWSINSNPLSQSQIFGNLISVSFDADADDIPVVASIQNERKPAERAQAIDHVSIR
jgi:hypothetical protein